MTWNDLVRKYYRDATDRDCEFILWETTSFPFSSAERVEQEIRDNQVIMLADRQNNLR
jgi:hypothetical protein